MQDFPANSNKAKVSTEPREKLKPVTSAETVRRKRGLGHKFKETFFGGSGRMAADYVVEEVVVPAIKDTLLEAFQGGMERLILGDRTRSRRRGIPPGYNSLGHIDYRGSYSRQQQASTPPQQRMLSRRSRARHDFDDLMIPSRSEANEVIDQMFEVLSRYGVVSVADLYELTGIQSSHTDMKWGWTDLRGAKAMPLRQGGYLLDLPEPEPLD